MRTLRYVIVVIGIFLQSGFYANAQPVINESRITVFGHSSDSTFYNAVDEIFNANAPISYIGFFPSFSAVRQRSLDLQLGEGANGYILEGVTDLQYTVMQGRRLYANHFLQTARLSFRYAPGVRMTKDNSSNVLPTNQKIGLQLDKVLWDSYTGNGWKGNRIESFEVSKRNFSKSLEPLHLLYLTAVAMHYSNGQAAGVWNDSVSNRNDYIKGDFSTNILSLSLNYTRYKNSMFSACLGYQRDGDWGGPFSFIPEQKKRYGQNRLTGYLQYRTKPWRHPLKKHLAFLYLDEKEDTVKLCLDRKWEFRLRADYEYILDKTSAFPGKSKYRLGTHVSFEAMPLRSRHIAFLLHFYYGRDYLNIRYDDPVIAVMAGLSFTLSRYKNPRFHPLQAVVSCSSETSHLQEKLEKMKK
jgi:hypothetical protein